MKVFIDTSVLLRRMFSEPEALAEWPRIREGFASRLLAVEAHRAIDRARLGGLIDDPAVETLSVGVHRTVASLAFVELEPRVLDRAAGPMPTALGTLDAIHLACALELRASVSGFLFATHDVQLARAARASGFTVIGA